MRLYPSSLYKCIYVYILILYRYVPMYIFLHVTVCCGITMLEFKQPLMLKSSKAPH